MARSRGRKKDVVVFNGNVFVQKWVGFCALNTLEGVSFSQQQVPYGFA